jgi:hypothetical protein
MKSGWMIIASHVTLVVAGLALVSCETDVSGKAPYRSLVGTVWRFKMDGYAVGDSGAPKYIPAGGYEYVHALSGPFDEKLVGKKVDNWTVVAAYPKGTLFRVDRVGRVALRTDTIDYAPRATLLNAPPLPGGKLLDLESLYSDGAATLDPKYTERVK